MILSETINLFISGGNIDLEDRMQRACLCDLDKLRDSINTEINALPPKKKELIKSTIEAYLAHLLENETRLVVCLEANMIIKIVDLIDPSTYKRTSEENFFFGTKIKRLIVESKIVNPKEKITVELIKDDSANARIINALTKSIVSQWEDIEFK